MSAVTISNVHKSFGKVEVLHGISVDVADGEFAVLVGPSGCGKSTLLRMIAGLEDIAEGEISIGGRSVNKVEAKDRNIAMVFQNYALYPHMTVAENMAFSLKLTGMSKPERRKRAEEAAEMLGLTEFLDRHPSELSGGQRQRVAMGRAMVRKPAVFLFDEPLSNLDAKLRVQMRAEIKQNHQRLGATTIYVTHDQVEAMTMADRIIVMRAGRVEQVGTPLELYDRPANLFVAGFIGSPAMNLLPGTLAGDAFVLEDGTHLGIGAPPPASQGSKLVLGIRSEHFALAEEGEGIGAKVITIDPTGSETQVTMQLAGHLVVAGFRERVGVPASGVLHVRPLAEGFHLFDAETGLRL